MWCGNRAAGVAAPRRSKGDARVYEQAVAIQDGCGHAMRARRITIVLEQPTRHGETEIHLLTNLPGKVKAGKVAELYRQRWTIETAFGEIAAVLKGEIDTLAYPKAALFAFCVGLLAYNVLSLVKAGLRSVHGEEKVAREVSGYFLADEVRCTWKGMMIAVPASDWTDRSRRPQRVRDGPRNASLGEKSPPAAIQENPARSQEEAAQAHLSQTKAPRRNFKDHRQAKERGVTASKGSARCPERAG